MVHVSTDYVFDGRRTVPEPYVEADPPDPISRYGVTKLAGEQAVLESRAACAVVRTAWLYGIKGRNFLKTVLKLALQNPERPLRVVDDQFGSPTWSFRLAQQILQIVEAGARGVFHATAEGHCSWYALADRFLTAMGIACRIEACTSAEFPRPAARPRNSILENTRLKSAGLHLMRDWQADLDEFVGQHRSELVAEARGEG